MSRKEDLDKFYEILSQLEDKLNGGGKLENCDGNMSWPERGVYFFLEAEEHGKSGSGLRVTRVGTHAVSEGSNTSMWDRLKMHQGTRNGNHTGGGNHRVSIFRRIVGEAIIEKDNLHEKYPHWGEGTADRKIRDGEHEMEKRVSKYIRNLPLLWLKVDDEPRPDSQRAYLTRNAIALLSNYGKDPIDSRGDGWLGKHHPKEEINSSGLWNVEHVGKSHDPDFLEVLETKVSNT